MFKVVEPQTEGPGSRAWLSGAPVSSSTWVSNTQTPRLVLTAAVGAPHLCTLIKQRLPWWLHHSPCFCHSLCCF